MIKCQTCGNENLEASQYCDECGAKLAARASGGNGMPVSSPQPIISGGSSFRGSHVTSVGIPPLVENRTADEEADSNNQLEQNRGSHARLIIERGESVDTEFSLSAEESNIGRWDADNGIFPDVDLDAHDPDAKVSRRHARILRRNGVYSIEDLGSTNGTFLNRGRRLLPGSPQILGEGDEIIVGKTFLRFRINN